MRSLVQFERKNKGGYDVCIPLLRSKLFILLTVHWDLTVSGLGCGGWVEWEVTFVESRLSVRATPVSPRRKRRPSLRSQAKARQLRPAQCSVMSNCSASPWTVAHQGPLSTGFPRREYWSGIKPASVRLQSLYALSMLPLL